MAEKRASADWALMIFLLAIAGAAVADPVCNVDSSQLSQCYPAVSGTSPPPPTPACCSVVRKVNIPCLCGLKSELPKFGLNPTLVYALPKKCGMKTKIPCAAQF